MPYLILRQPGRLALNVALRDGVRAGRDEGNDLRLEDHRVSRQHAVFARAGDGWEVRDNGSRHGTLVNGERVTARRLAEGDCIQMGDVLLEFHEADDPQLIVHQQVTEVGPPLRDTRADRRLALLYDISRAISSLDDTEAMLAEMLEAVVDVLGCERALVGLGDLERGVLRRFARARTGATAKDIVVSRAVLEATLDRREAVIVRDARREVSPSTMVRERILSAMAVPIGLGARPMGFLYVDDRQHAERFDARDLTFLTALGHFLAAALENAERYQRAEAMAEAVSSSTPIDELIGKSPVMARLKSQVVKYAGAVRAHVLVRGESGSGKELVARALHSASPRAGGPFVTLNCAAIPESMIESELFGHEKGAFTGAVRAKRGKFVLADGGSLFLDEIGDLALPAQAKLLRAIQEGEVQPLGAERDVRVDARIISATHKDLRAEIEAGRFREDLYYRLAVAEIEVPPLRSRKDDVELIAASLIRKAAEGMGKHVEGITETALAALTRHDWPGNVRELRNEVERAVINAEAPLIDAHDLSPRLGAARPMAAGPRPRSLVERFAELEPTEKQLVEEAIAQAKGNLSEAARLLGITRIMIKRRIDKFGLKVAGE